MSFMSTFIFVRHTNGQAARFSNAIVGAIIFSILFLKYVGAKGFEIVKKHKIYLAAHPHFIGQSLRERGRSFQHRIKLICTRNFSVQPINLTNCTHLKLQASSHSKIKERCVKS